MRLPTLLTALLASAGTSSATASTADDEPVVTQSTVAIYIQPVGTSSSGATSTAPSLLAEIALPAAAAAADASDKAEVLNYIPPELPEEDDDKTGLVRIGVYDPVQGRWVSSTSVAGRGNFEKGFAPNFVITVDEGEEELGQEQGKSGKQKKDNKAAAAGKEKKSSTPLNVLGVTLRGIAIDAGVTRDFGPQAAVVRTRPGAQPSPGKPVVLSPEGRKVVEEGEKTFLQKYWWALVLGFFLLLGPSGEGK
ncbi:hypothetical protein VTJ04DRAFT_9256 [Mycothermus thermophilus]|uniref:uncharacterized protein n=1 Tax=Humicola insolens TaxID=85995 RepID=UPI003742CF31